MSASNQHVIMSMVEEAMQLPLILLWGLPVGQETACDISRYGEKGVSAAVCTARIGMELELI